MIDNDRFQMALFVMAFTKIQCWSVEKNTFWLIFHEATPQG